MTDHAKRIGSSSDEDGKLERIKRQIDEAQDRAQRLRDTEAQAIERYLRNLDGFAEAAIRKHTGGSVSLRDFQSHLLDWNDDLLDGRTPAKLQGTALETDRERASALLSYVMLVQSLRSDAERGIVHAQRAAGRLDDTKVAEVLTLELQVQGEADRAQEHQAEVVQRMRGALERYEEALPDLLEALRVALGLLASMDPEALIRGAKVQANAHAQGVKAHQQAEERHRAGAALFRRIIKGEETTRLDEIWAYAGTSHYPTAKVEGVTYRFEGYGTKRDRELEIFRLGKDGEETFVGAQGYGRTTLYQKWRKPALDSLDKK